MQLYFQQTINTMKKSVYLLQPTYRKMDGTLVKGLPIFNYAINMPIISACIPNDWEKEICIEYFDEVNLETDASVVIMMSPGYDLAHAVTLAQEFKRRGKFIIFGSHTDELSDRLMREICDVVYYGYPQPSTIAELLNDIRIGLFQPEYRWKFGIDFAFDYSVFKNHDLPFIPVMASTGCKNDCSYCCYPPVFGGRYRLRHIERVIDDLRAVQKFNKPISFLDGNLFNNREYLLRLCNAIADSKLKIRWGGQATIDIAEDGEILSALKKARCRLLLFGLETLEPENSAQLHKEMYPVQKFESQINKIQQAGIRAGAYFIFGLDSDTKNTFNKVRDFIHRTNVAVPYLHVLVPIAGTAIYHQLRNEGRLLAENFEDYLQQNPEFSVPCSFAYFRPKSMTALEVEEEYLRLNSHVYRLDRIIARSISVSIRDMWAFLQLNLEARSKYKAMVRGYQLRKNRHRQSAKNESAKNEIATTTA